MTELREKLNNIVEEVRTKVIPENIKAGVTIFNVTGTHSDGIDTSDANATKDDIVLGKSAYVNGEKIIGTIPAGDIVKLGETITTNKPYIELEYITSDADSYIDTGVAPTSVMGAELDVKCTNTNPGAFFGSWYNQQGILFGQSAHQNEYGIYKQGYAMATTSQWVFANETSNSNWHSFIYRPDTSTSTIDGTQIDLPAISDYTETIYLFRGNIHSEITSDVSISSCKLYDNGTLIKNYIPVIRKSDNVVCMYDLVNNEFIENAGTGTFIAGPEVEYDLTGILNLILVEKETKILPENIKAGVQIFDTEGEYAGIDTSDATATAADILSGKTAYVNGEKIIGNLGTDAYITISEEEPTGENRKKFWVQKGKNLADMDDFQINSFVEGSGTSGSVSGNDIKVNTYWGNPWTAGRFRSIDLRGYEGKYISASLEIKETNSENGGFLLGTCDVNVENKQTLNNFYMFTKNDGRVSLTAQIPEIITDTNQYLYMQLNATGSYTTSSYNTYTTYTNIQLEIGDVATEYEVFYGQKLFIKNLDGEYVTFDKDTKF